MHLNVNQFKTQRKKKLLTLQKHFIEDIFLVTRILFKLKCHFHFMIIILKALVSLSEYHCFNRILRKSKEFLLKKNIYLCFLFHYKQKEDLLMFFNSNDLIENVILKIKVLLK